MLKQRLISGVAMGGLLVAAALYAPPLLALAILVALGLLGQREFYAMVQARGQPVARALGMTVGTALIATTFGCLALWPGAADDTCRLEELVLLLGVLGLMVSQVLARERTDPLGNIAFTLLGVLYVPYLLNFLTRLVFTWPGAGSRAGIGATGCRLIMFLVLTVKITDAGAYTFGRLFGRHLMCPRLSPKKTWEGAAGGVASAVAAAWIFTAVTGGRLGAVHLTQVDAVILGVLLALSGQAGDLFESVAKRHAGIKDSGACVPGMGGVLDVLDSLLLGGPVLYVYVRFVAAG